MTTDNSPASALLSIRWKTLSVALAILTLAALTTTVIVASVRSVDILSVVALALAVVAFVVQILVYIVQTASSENQTQHWSNLYTQMTTALATIEEKSERTRDAVDRLDPTRVQQALGKATSEARASASDDETPKPPSLDDDQLESVSKRVSELLNAPRAVTSTTAHRPVPKPSPSFLDEPIPAERIETALLALANLTNLGASSIRRLARDERDQRRSGVGQVGLASISKPEPLYEAGLITRRSVPWSTVPVFQLTDAGRDVGRLIIKPPAMVRSRPDYREAIRALKELDDMQSRLQRQMREAGDAIPVETEDVENASN